MRTRFVSVVSMMGEIGKNNTRPASMELNGANNPSATHNSRVASEFRSSASQCYAAFATNLLKYAYGSIFGFTSLLVAQLYKPNAEIKMSLSELTWFSSTCFMVPVGSLLVGLLAQHVGSRLTLLASSLAFITAWTIFHFASDSVTLLCAEAIAGLFVGVALGPGTTYVVEMAQTHLRSILVASTNLSAMIGVFLTVLMSNFLHWRSIALVNLAFPIAGFAAVCSIPESPHWLASKGRFIEAEASLSWLRGWTTPNDTAAEFATLKDTYSSTNSSRKSDYKSYLHRSFYLPIASVCYMFVAHSCTGYSALPTFCIVIFDTIRVPIDSRAAASIFDGMRILGAIVCLFSVHYAGKRRLMMVSLIGGGLSYATIAILLILKRWDLVSERMTMIAPVAMIFAGFIMSAGVDKVVFMLNAELFPTTHRNVGAGIGIFVHSVCSAVANKLFLYILEAITLAGVFTIFAVACFVSCASFYYIFPETEGRTLREIEEHYAGTNRLRNDGIVTVGERKENGFLMGKV